MTHLDEENHTHSFKDLMAIITQLRRPDGCPWDKSQTHSSLRRNLLEECYEALDALDRKDSLDLREELGDILIQVAFHSSIAEDENEFTTEEMFRQVSDKLIRRHPHVFGNDTAKDVKQVEENWQTLKMKERGNSSILEGPPSNMPALAYSQTISHRAARSGFEWSNIEGVLEKLQEELEELQSAKTAEEKEMELGDVLFTIVNLARWLEIDAESALRQSMKKFISRFSKMEILSKEMGTEFSSIPMENKQVLWNQVKSME
jgi:tetrapyrrole methylase family protein/MazG family protein